MRYQHSDTPENVLRNLADKMRHLPPLKKKINKGAAGELRLLDSIGKK